LGRPGSAITTQATMTTAKSRTRRMLGAHLARNRLTNAKGPHHRLRDRARRHRGPARTRARADRSL